MRTVLPVALTAILLCGSAHAQNDQIHRAPRPTWAVPSELLPVPANASGLIFIRRQDVLIRLTKDGQDRYQDSRIKILHPNALQMGNVSIAWNPMGGAPQVHGIMIYRDGETIDVLKSASFEVLRREDQLEAAKLSGTLTAILHVPDLRVGDELEVALTVHTKDPTLGAQEAGLLLLAPDPAPGRYTLGLNWDPDSTPQLKMTAEMAKAAKNSDHAVLFQFDNPPTLIPPKDAPARFQWQRVVEFSQFPDWASISRRLAPLFTKASTLSAGSALKREAARIAAAHPKPLDRANAALKLVQQDVRYVYVGLNGGNLTPATADETWQRRYGDCKGKSAMLLALLKDLGIEAEPVLINTAGSDDGLDLRLPNPGMFDHVVVRAHIDGETYWLDGTLPPVVPASARPTFPAEWVLPLTARGTSIERFDWRPAKRPDQITLVDMDERAGFDQPARVSYGTILRGIPGLQQQLQFSGLTPDQLLSGFRQQLLGGAWRTIDDVQWHYDVKAQASILTIAGTWSVDWDDDGGGAKSVALPGGGFSPPDRRARPEQQDQSLPYANKPGYECNVTTVRLPSTTVAAQWSYKNGYDTHIFGQNYYRAFELRDGAIRMVRGFRVEKDEIDAATARRDNDRIANFDNSMGYIFYRPDGRKAPARTGSAVPTVSEIDWTLDDVPCLSVAAKH